MLPYKKLLTAEEIEVSIWGFVVVVVTLILVFIVGSMLYSIIFVVQPIKSMSPIDQAFTKMLNDVILLIVGGIGGIMSKRASKAISNAFGSSPTPPYPQCAAVGQYPQGSAAYAGSQGSSWQSVSPLPTFVNPPLDESWTPGPPPSTPDDFLHPEREDIASERMAAREET